MAQQETSPATATEATVDWHLHTVRTSPQEAAQDAA